MTELLVSPSVSLVDNRPATTSLAIAEHFGKSHADVLKSVRKVMSEMPEDLRERNFSVTFRTVAGPNNSQRQEEFFIIYQDGFMLLVMGYTGAKAMRIKIAYIVRFNEMAEELRRRINPAPALPSSDSPITPDQQCTLQAMVKGLVEKGGIYANIWSRFNNHFRLGSYKQLPQTRMSEAVGYLMAFEVKPWALPEPEKKALPETAPKLSTRYDDAHQIEKKMNSIQEQLFQKTCTFMQDMENLSRQANESFSHPARVSNVATPFDAFAHEQHRIIISLAEQAYHSGSIAVRQMRALAMFAPHLKKVFG